jgi:hypothetical protein
MEIMKLFIEFPSLCKRFLFITAFFLCCVEDPVTVDDYSPPVVFTGLINGAYDSLGGNPQWRNSCTMVEDTLRMFFFSNGFWEKDKVRDGDLIRIDIFPETDSTENDTFLTNGRVLFHMARYLSTNTTYNISRNDRQSKVEMVVNRMNLVSGGEVEFSDIIIQTAPLIGGGMLEVTEARIKGVIE